MSVSDDTSGFFKSVTDRSVEEQLSQYEDEELCKAAYTGTLSDEVNEEYSHLQAMSDNRSVKQLIEDTIENWLIEDALFELIDKFDEHQVEHNGSDATRSIATSSEQVTTEPDLLINGQEVEVVSDFTGYWLENNRLEMRSHKFDNLNPEDYILGVDVQNEMFFLVQKKQFNSPQYIETYWPYGGSSVYRVQLQTVDLLDLSEFHF